VPRIRTIKPELWESERLGRLPVLARLTFIGLISMADDEGRGRGDPLFLRGRLHPYAGDVGAEEFGKAMDALVAAKLVMLYIVEECAYYKIPGWGEHQKIERPSKSRIPDIPERRLTEDSVKPHRKLTEASPKPHRSLGEDSPLDLGSRTKDLGSRTKDLGSRTKDLNTLARPKSAARGFEKFWAAYPRKRSKGDAIKAWDKIAPGPELVEAIVASVETHKRHLEWLKDAGQFVPYPASWLNARGWEDDLTEGKPKLDRRAQILAEIGGKFE
jgi:hypothetical protein